MRYRVRHLLPIAVRCGTQHVDVLLHRSPMSRESHLLFADRREAGAELATKLKRYAGRDDVVVLALPRGGVPVGVEVAEALDAALDIFLVRKLGMPGHREYAIGAIASGGVRVLSEDVVRTF